MRIASVASAFPKHYYKQEIVVEALKKQWRKSLPNADILDRLDESMKVEGRYAVESIEFYENMQTWGEANNAWIKHALDLGEKSLCRALQKAGLEPRDLSAIFVTSVTGITANARAPLATVMSTTTGSPGRADTVVENRPPASTATFFPPTTTASSGSSFPVTITSRLLTSWPPT